ncbi:GNAT superfamily N-acetyltransferase [Microbacterium testaceum]|uniref:GNAT family N-acetyltransferase n=1 Tax=Microbacterium TaxID=33882 RepID=UPI00278212ED|nr:MULTISPECIES: GNAT family N-acetyltransferase [Microbacterium]MDQ1111560.1 GNAT superfamily N-acetyltransferase [Microbacterium testaceum]MDR6097905.1 GNAT superfamily N-acetyltransferase [Microbacterium sp. SORGH_AS_0454]
MSDESSRPAQLRLASFSDVESLTDLRFEWDQPGMSPAEDERANFARRFARWWQEAESRSACAVAEVDGQLIGAAWLLIHERVPNPSHFDRAAGDIQSVYVRPAYRRAGIGRGLVRVLLAEGQRRAISRFTVESNDHALRLYQEEGFVSSRLRLERTPIHGSL